MDSLATTCFWLVLRSTSWVLLDFLPRPGFHWEFSPGSWFLNYFLQKNHIFRTFWWELDVSWISWHYLDFSRVYCYELDFFLGFLGNLMFVPGFFGKICFLVFLPRSSFLLDSLHNIFFFRFLVKFLFFLVFSARSGFYSGFFPSS